MGDKSSVRMLSLSVLLILAILGPFVTGLRISGIHIFPFIIYLATFQLPLTLIYLSNNRTIVVSKNDMIVFLFLLYVLISVVWGTDTVASLKAVGVLAPSMAIGILLSLEIENSEDLWVYINTLKLFTVVVVGIGFLGSVLNVQMFGMHWFGERGFSRGWYPNRNDLSYFLSIVSAFFLANGFRSDLRDLIRVAEIMMFAILSWIILLNQSRSAILGQILIVVGMVVVFHSRRADSGDVADILQEIKRPFTSIGILSLPVLAILFNLISNPFVFMSENSLRTRWNLHEGAFLLLRENTFGVGVGNFSAAYDQLDLFPGGINPHSWFAHVLGEFGIVGIVLFLYLYGRLLDESFFRARDGGSLLPVAIFGALVAFSFAGLAPDDSINMQITWILFGLSIAGLRIY